MEKSRMPLVVELHAFLEDEDIELGAGPPDKDCYEDENPATP